jgi:uncharacterized SAM-binding protein YcdF (DUF218 family)
MPKLLRHAFFITATLGLAYGLGFAAFVATLPKPFTTLPAGTEGLAVFTGGAGRIETALRLMQQGFEGPVLISGLHPATRMPDILAQAAPTPALTEARTRQSMLDTAASTNENMQSLKLWAATANLHQVAVITSTYHAARVRLLGLWHVPHLSLTILAVQPEDSSFSVLLREYHKLLVAPLLR